VSISNHIWTSAPMHHIWPTDVYFPVFHSSLFILLPFLHSSNRSFPSCLLPLSQNESKCETIHMTSTYRFIFHANQTQVSHEESLWNKSTREHSSMSCLTGAFDFPRTLSNLIANEKVLLNLTNKGKTH